MLSKKRIVADLLLAAPLLTATLLACGPGDAPYRFFVKSLELRLHDADETGTQNSMKLLGNCGAPPTQIKADIGLMKSDLPGMQSIPRHLRMDPTQRGWVTEVTPISNGSTSYSIRIRGARPQELQFQPGNYLVAVTGYANCSEETAASKLPFVYYSAPRNFSPGREVSLLAEAKFAGSTLGCSSNSSNTGGFVELSLNALPDSGGGTPASVQLFSPTAPSLNGDYSSCTSYDSYLGPVPNRGRYFVRYRDANNALKCYKFEGTGENTALTGTEITRCPATGSLGI